MRYLNKLFTALVIFSIVVVLYSLVHGDAVYVALMVNFLFALLFLRAAERYEKEIYRVPADKPVRAIRSGRKIYIHETDPDAIHVELLTVAVENFISEDPRKHHAGEVYLLGKLEVLMKKRATVERER